MNRRTLAPLLALALLAAPGAGRAAAAAGLRHEKTVYADARDAALKLPEGVGCDDKGAFVVADTGNGRLLLFKFQDGAVSGGTEVKLPQLPYPTRVQVGPQGDVYVLDRKQKKIVKLDAAGAFAGFVEPSGASGAGTVVPSSFKVDGTGKLALLDVAGRRVLVLDPAGKVLREAPLPKDGFFTDVAVDPDGRVLALDGVNAAVFALPKDKAEFQPLGVGLKDKMSFPVDLEVWKGKLFLVDQNGHGIAVLGLDGTYVGRELAMGWSEGALYYPSQLCIDAGGDAFLADRNNSRVQVFSIAR